MMKLTVLFSLLFVLCVGATSNNKLLISRRELQSTAYKRVEDVFAEFNVHEREKRAPGDGPSFEKSNLNDTHNFGITVYSGLVNSEVIYSLTYNTSNSGITSSNVYRSTNYGKSFERITARIGNVLLPSINVGLSDHKKVFFIDAITPILYISLDEGNTFTARTITPNTILPFTITRHPTMEDWLLAIDAATNTLYVSRDLGSTPFKKIADGVDFFQWGEYPHDQDNSTVYYISNEIIYTQSYPYDDSTRQVFDRSLKANGGLLIVDRYIFVVTVSEDDDILLWVSADRNPLRQALIPRNYNHERYIVDSIRSLQVLVIVHHSNDQYNLYFSEEQGIYYYLSLADISVNSETLQIDLAVTMNFTTYIANQYYDDSPNLKTMISFDAGANWNSITPPTDNDIDCVKPLCSLHLHMATSEYWRTGVYSQESAPGIVIAHGATGRYLTDESVNLFISRDGGSSWSMTLNGTWGVSVLDHGGLIVAARDHNNDEDASRTIMYTCDEGMSWTPLTVTTNDITVFGVITEPGETTTVVSLYGIEGSSWVIVTIEFKDIFLSVCDDSNDYYNWTPYDQYSDNGCLLGALVTIERRNPLVCCLNTHTYIRVVDYSICRCTIEDYECDHGFEHIGGRVCIRDDSLSITCESRDSQTQGYRKISGDVCSGGIENDIKPVNGTVGGFCNILANTDSDKSYQIPFEIVTILLVICVLIIIGLVVILIIVRSKKGQNQFEHQVFSDSNIQISAADATGGQATNMYDTPIDKELEAMKNNNY